MANMEISRGVKTQEVRSYPQDHSEESVVQADKKPNASRRHPGYHLFPRRTLSYSNSYCDSSSCSSTTRGRRRFRKSRAPHAAITRRKEEHAMPAVVSSKSLNGLLTVKQASLLDSPAAQQTKCSQRNLNHVPSSYNSNTLLDDDDDASLSSLSLSGYSGADSDTGEDSDWTE